MNRRILIVDDNPALQLEFRRLLGGSSVSAHFDSSAEGHTEDYELTFAISGDDAIARVESAVASGQPFAAAFVDLRMPPGMDGVTTTAALWKIDPDLQIVLCTGHDDYTWSQIVARLERSERLLILEKPFHALEVQQLAFALTQRWLRARELRERYESKDKLLAQRLEELARARSSIERADAAKGVFLAHMSHELRTPMTAIMGYCDLLLDPEQTTDERTQNVQTIRRNSDQLLALINDLMDLSKLDAGTLSIVPMDCSPIQVLQDVVASMQPRAGQLGLTLDIECEGNLPPTVRTDPARLRQILSNVIANALRVSKGGSGKRLPVRVRLIESEQAEGGSAQLQFEFSEPGIADLLQQQSQTLAAQSAYRARRFGGTGLGLALAKRLAEMLGGNLEMQSEGVTHKAVLTIDAGAVAPPGHDQCPLTEPAPVASEKPQTLFGRILVAEDGADNQRLIRRFLERMGLHVTTVENGKRALECTLASESESFDIIVMDIHMPEMDGLEATGRLRAAGVKLPIIALTADAMEGERERCIAAGCDDYMAKPIDREKFDAIIRKYLPFKTVQDLDPARAAANLHEQIAELNRIAEQAIAKKSHPVTRG